MERVGLAADSDAWRVPLELRLDLRGPLAGGYAAALALTHFSGEGLVCVAWDAAGVTTGPVTVPLVLAIGSSMAASPACRASEGFGILACAAMGPILAVLGWGLVKVGPKR